MVSVTRRHSSHNVVYRHVALAVLALCLCLLLLSSPVRCDVPADVDSAVPPPEGCTAIAVSRSASLTSPLTTHTNDCKDCDFRLSHVPAATHSADSRRAVYASRFAYPRFLGDERGTTFLPSNTDFQPYQWRNSQPVGYVRQVERTYAYIDGAYGVVNEAGLAIGESTCAGRLVARPVYANGTALFDVSELTRIAMERASTAVEAIELMGGLAEQYGYYGAEWEGDYARGEAGEALTIADTHSAWIFHITPDDTGRGAVWAARRVPDGHVAVVSNAFIIQQLNLSDSHNYRASANVYAVAERLGWYNRSSSSEPLNFARVYGSKVSFEVYCSRRSWRVMTLLAPSLADTLSPDAGVLTLPFSVPVDRAVSVRDLFAINRDHYENTTFDLTRGPAAGPYGNPNRYDRGEASGLPMAALMQGTFERPISMFRTSYSTVTESESGGLARVWYGAGAPHATFYVPLWPAAGEVPVEVGKNAGSLYRWQDGSAWWLVTAISNWSVQSRSLSGSARRSSISCSKCAGCTLIRIVALAAVLLCLCVLHRMERMWCHISVDVSLHQHLIERHTLNTLSKLQHILPQPPPHSTTHSHNTLDPDTIGSLQQLQSQLATNGTAQLLSLLLHLLAKYHDGYRIDDFHAESLDPVALFYPYEWLKDVGFWGERGAEPDLKQTNC